MTGQTSRHPFQWSSVEMVKKIGILESADIKIQSEIVIWPTDYLTKKIGLSDGEIVQEGSHLSCILALSMLKILTWVWTFRNLNESAAGSEGVIIWLELRWWGREDRLLGGGRSIKGYLPLPQDWYGLVIFDANQLSCFAFLGKSSREGVLITHNVFKFN